jgi:hypothetical protein
VEIRKDIDFPNYISNSYEYNDTQLQLAKAKAGCLLGRSACGDKNLKSQ